MAVLPFPLRPKGPYRRLFEKMMDVWLNDQGAFLQFNGYSQDGEIGQLDNAYIIRKWGTTEGLGELAVKGPLLDDAPNGPMHLDKCPPIRFHIREVVFLMEVKADAWGKQFD